MVDHYVKTHLKNKAKTNPKHALHLDNYILLLGQKPGIIEELKVKILAKQGKHSNKSVFFKETLMAETIDLR